MGNGLGRTGIAVYWNVESCPIPENIEPSFIWQRIEATLKRYGYCVPLTIRAYGKLEQHTEEALRIAGIDVIKFEREKDTAKKYMLVDISNWALDICCPATCMLISGDLGFSHLVDKLKQRGHNFLLAHPNPGVSELLEAARHVWGWPQLLLDEKAAFWPFIPVIWDFENCGIPRNTVNPCDIFWKIKEYLENHGYFERVIITAYGDTKNLAPSLLKTLRKKIDVIHVDRGKDAADMRIMVDLPFLARNDMSAGVCMLISGDTDFMRLVHSLVQGGLKFVHCRPRDQASAFDSLADMVTMVCYWPDIVTRKPSQPLLMNAASASDPSDNSISNVIPFQSSTEQQTVVAEKHLVHDIMLIILVIATFLLVGASKPLPQNLFPDFGEAVAVLGTSIFLLDDLGVITLFVRERRSTYRVSKNAGVPNRSLTGALWVLSLIFAFLGCVEANKRLELWLIPGSVSFLLHYLPVAVLEEYFEILKFFGWRV